MTPGLTLSRLPGTMSVGLPDFFSLICDPLPPGVTLYPCFPQTFTISSLEQVLRGVAVIGMTGFEPCGTTVQMSLLIFKKD